MGALSALMSTFLSASLEVRDPALRDFTCQQQHLTKLLEYVSRQANSLLVRVFDAGWVQLDPVVVAVVDASEKALA
eukprot:3300046-Pleurochrysis_carterae.AAC.1